MGHLQVCARLGGAKAHGDAAVSQVRSCVWITRGAGSGVVVIARIRAADGTIFGGDEEDGQTALAAASCFRSARSTAGDYRRGQDRA